MVTVTDTQKLRENTRSAIEQLLVATQNEIAALEQQIKQKQQEIANYERIRNELGGPRRRGRPPGRKSAATAQAKTGSRERVSYDERSTALLAVLGDSEMSVNEIARAMGLTPPYVRYLALKMVQDGQLVAGERPRSPGSDKMTAVFSRAKPAKKAGKETEDETEPASDGGDGGA